MHYWQRLKKKFNILRKFTFTRILIHSETQNFIYWNTFKSFTFCFNFFMQIPKQKRKNFARSVNLLIKRYISKYLAIYEENNRAIFFEQGFTSRFRSSVSIQHSNFVTRLWKNGSLILLWKYMMLFRSIYCSMWRKNTFTRSLMEIRF